jgi:hypothetical protein
MATKGSTSQSKSRSSGSGRSRTAKAKSSGRSGAKSNGPSASGRRGSGKRDLVQSPNASFYAKRGARGEFREMDEQGRSLTADRRRRAKTTAKPGYGDRGDRKGAATSR